MQDPRLVRIDPVQTRSTWNALKTHPTVGCCIQTLKHAVFAGGVICGDHDSPVSRSHISCMANLAIDWILCVGIVPITFVDVDGACLPNVPSPEAVELFSMMNDAGTVEHKAQFSRHVDALSMFADNSTKEKGRLLVWNKTGYPPDAHGNLCTPMMRVAQGEQFVAFIKRRARVAEQLRTNPLLISQSRAVRNGDTEGVTWNVPDDVVVAAEEARLKTVEDIQQRHKTLHTTITALDQASLAEDEELFRKECEPTEYFMAAERDASRTTQVASPLSELRHLIALSKTEIHNTLGVPEGLNHGAGASLSASGNNLQAFSFNAHIMALKRTIEEFISDSLEVVHSSAHAGTTDIDTHNRRKVQIPGATFVPQATVFELLDRGVISEVECRRILRSSIGLDNDSGNDAKSVKKRPRDTVDKPDGAVKAPEKTTNPTATPTATPGERDELKPQRK